MNQVDQNYYALISGRWYRSRTLNGHWDYVSAKKLPSDFAQIPENHPKGTALASVAGTPQAQEAGISNEIPQTATVNRNQASLNIQYDGPPQFRPIEATPLQYAVNTSVPVIQVDAHTYYAVSNGIWFVAASPEGPWAVATQVPAVIYTIPPSSPLYYVTYVHIYGSTPDVAYVGYTPGYLNSYYCNDGVVVFGTGYVYPPWIGTFWIGHPVTFGFGVFWGLGYSWAFHGPFFSSAYLGPAFYPWWGPWAGPRYFGHRGVSVEQVNVYRNWGSPIVRNTWDRNAVANRTTTFRPGRPNNIYTSPTGRVFRYSDRGWEERGAGGWVTRSPAPARPLPEGQNVGRGGERADDLEKNRIARSIGESHWNTFRGAPPAAIAHGGRHR